MAQAHQSPCCGTGVDRAQLEDLARKLSRRAGHASGITFDGHPVRKTTIKIELNLKLTGRIQNGEIGAPAQVLVLVGREAGVDAT
jgi:hypothetical protein